jgi:hypothetical protein
MGCESHKGFFSELWEEFTFREEVKKVIFKYVTRARKQLPCSMHYNVTVIWLLSDHYDTGKRTVRIVRKEFGAPILSDGTVSTVSYTQEKKLSFELWEKEAPIRILYILENTCSTYSITV